MGCDLRKQLRAQALGPCSIAALSRYLGHVGNARRFCQVSPRRFRALRRTQLWILSSGVRAAWRSASSGWRQGDCAEELGEREHGVARGQARQVQQRRSSVTFGVLARSGRDPFRMPDVSVVVRGRSREPVPPLYGHRHFTEDRYSQIARHTIFRSTISSLSSRRRSGAVASTTPRSPTRCS
jgi:hypothetical protein